MWLPNEGDFHGRRRHHGVQQRIRLPPALAFARRGDRVYALINNAGIGGTAGSIEELSDAAWMQVIDTNLMGPIRCTRAVLPTMRAQGSGTIVNVSSISGRIYGNPILAVYCASKHALCSLSDSMSGEVESFGIRVACIEPGMFATSTASQVSSHLLTYRREHCPQDRADAPEPMCSPSSASPRGRNLPPRQIEGSS